LEKKSLIFFNKEGLPLNTSWSDTLKAWTAKIMFDHNGPDTFKTIGLYAFEKVPARTINDTLEFYPLQSYASGAIRTHRSKQFINAQTTYEANTSSLFFTKWLESNESLTDVKVGDILVPRSNVNGSEFFTSINGQTNFFVVLRKEDNRVLVKTSVNNYNYANKEYPIFFDPINYICWPSDTLDNNILSQLQINDKLNLIGSGASDGVYTIAVPPAIKQVNEVSITSSDLVGKLAVGKTLDLNIVFSDDRISAYNGNIIMGEASKPNRITFANSIAPVLKVGDIVILRSNTPELLLAPNFNDLVVTAIDKNNKWIEVDIDLTSQSLSASLFLRKNEITLKTSVQTSRSFGSSIEIPDEEATLRAFFIEHEKTLNQYRISINFNENTDTILVKNILPENYITYNFNTNNLLVKSGTIREHWIIPVKENINSLVSDKKYSKYKRTIVFKEIDEYGLNMEINNKFFNIKGDDTVNKTLLDWLDLYQPELEKMAIDASVVNNKLIISAKYPDAPVRIKMNMGSTSVYYTEHSSCAYKDMGKSMTINVSGITLTAEVQADIASTIDHWIQTNYNRLKEYNLAAERLNNTLVIGTEDPEKTIKVEYIDYRTQRALVSGVVNLRSANECAIISSNRINSYSSTNFINEGLATGQVIGITSDGPYYINKQYNIIDVKSDRLTLSYQGPAILHNGVFKIESSEFLREPRSGFEGDDPIQLAFSWGSSTADMFMYDFSETQLPNSIKTKLVESGLSPILEHGQVRLNTETKLNPDGSISVDQVQTVFNEITYELDKINSITDITAEPEPLQVFIGYKGDDEGVDNAQVLIHLRENRKKEIVTSANQNVLTFHSDNRVTFLDAHLTVSGANTNFISMGFKAGQKIRFTGEDNNLDGRNLLGFKNAGKEFEILEIFSNEIILKPLGKSLVDETSTGQVNAFIPPYYVDGEMRKIDRHLTIEIEQLPELVAVFDIYGQTEIEDERFKIDLDSYGRNISLNDLFILKTYEGVEAGVDWPILNRKRKEMLMLHRDIYDYVSTYRSILTAIDFWGYTDLDLIEYYINLDSESDGFGKLHSEELVRTFNGTRTGWARTSTKKIGDTLKKANMFSLSYKLTDGQGNYIEGYNFDELYNKLFGLQQWLEDNILPMNVRLLGIHGKIQTGATSILAHRSFMQQHVKSSGKHTPVVSIVNGYLSPITDYQYPNYNENSVYLENDIVWHEGKEWLATRPENYTDLIWPLGVVPGSVQGEGYWANLGVNHSKPYNITIDFKVKEGHDVPEYFHVKITTYGITKWDSGETYNADDKVYHNGKIYTFASGDNAEPGTNFTSWVLTDESQNSAPVQFIEKTLYSLERITFSVNRAIDPLFVISVYTDNGSSMGWLDKKIYSVGSLLTL
jgi:hypothetical protein